MGLSRVFSMLVNRAVKEVVKEVVKEKENETVQIRPSEFVKEHREGMTRAELKSRIRQCLASMGGITYQEDLPAAAIDVSAHPAAKPIDFMISKGGKYVLAIVVVSLNTYKSMPVKGTQMLVEDQNVTYLRFFVEKENRMDYISQRISKHL